MTWIFLLIAQLIIAVILVPYGYASDSATHMLSSCLVSKGLRLYADFLTNHGPLMITVNSWIYKLIGNCNMLTPRFLLFIMVSAVIWLIAIYGKSMKSSFFLILMYALLSISYGTTAFLSENWMISVALTLFSLINFYKYIPRKLFFILFAFVELSLFLESPVYIPCGIIVLTYFCIKRQHDKKLLLLMGFLPSILFLLLFVPLKDYWNVVYAFNWHYYAAISRWGPYSYWNYFRISIDAVFQIFTTPKFWTNTGRFMALLELAIIATWIVIKIWKFSSGKKKLDYYASLIIPLLLFMRPDSYHMIPFLFFLLAEIIYFLPKKSCSTIILAIIFLLGVRVFISPDRYYFFKLYGNTIKYYDSIVTSNTKLGDKILLFTSQPDSFLLTDRMPGSYYWSDITWASIIPGALMHIESNITKNNVKLIIIEVPQGTFAGQSAQKHVSPLLHFLDTNHSYSKTMLPINNALLYIRTSAYGRDN